MPGLKPNELHALISVHWMGKTGSTVEIEDILESKGLVYFKEATWHCTSLGTAHVKQVCTLPLPTRKEVIIDHKGDVI